MKNDIIFEDDNIYNSEYKYDKILTEIKKSFVVDNRANFYYNGVLNFHEHKVSVRNLKLLSTNIGYVLDYIHGKDIPEDVVVNKIFNFADTSAFEIFVNKYIGNVCNNELDVNEDIIFSLNSIIVNFDGKINNMVPETMALNAIEVG